MNIVNIKCTVCEYLIDENEKLRAKVKELEEKIIALEIARTGEAPPFKPGIVLDKTTLEYIQTC